MPEQYQVYFSSRGSNVIDKSNLNAVIYSVNWSNFLNPKYKRFLCQFIFKSENWQTNNTGGGINTQILTSNGFMNLSGTQGYTYDGTSRSNNYGIIYSVVQEYNPTGYSTSYYCSTNNDNNQFYMDYPTNTNVILTLQTFSGVNMLNMPNYCMFLNMVGVDED